MALKGMQNGKGVGIDGIPVEVWKSLGEERVTVRYVVGSVMEEFSSRGKRDRRMEGQCDCTNF